MDLRSWLEEFLGSRHDACRGSDMRSEIGPGGQFLVRGHPSLLGDLLENLLENASKYSEPGTPIVVRLARDDEATSITVSDRGIGIDVADLPHLFEPFYRSQAARGRAAAGVGLGLSIALRLARSLGATIEARIQPGGGSSFTIRFPSQEAGAGGERSTLARDHPPPAGPVAGLSDQVEASQTGQAAATPR